MSFKLISFGIFALIAIATPAVAGSEDTKTVRELEHSFYTAFVEGDDEVMNELFASSFVYQHGSGSTFDKGQFLSLIKTGAITVSRADTPSMTVRDLGDTIVTFGSGIVEGKAGEDTFSIDLRFVNVWHKQDSVWRLVHRNSETLP